MQKKTKSGMFTFLFSKHPDYYWKQMLTYMTLLVVVVFVGGRYLADSMYSTQEGFQQQKEFILEMQESTYDPFYAEIYDQIHPNSPESIYKIIRYIERETQPSIEQSLFLEIGCGTGKCLFQIQEKGYKIEGIDQSPAMIHEAKETCGCGVSDNVGGNGRTNFKTKNILSSSRIYEEDSFSHILCLGPTTLYEICSPVSSFLNQEASILSHSNLHKFLKHMKRWLKRGGYLIIQIEPLSILSQSWVSTTGGKTSYSPKFPKHISHPDAYSTEIRFSEVDYLLEMIPSVPSFPSTDSKGSFLGDEQEEYVKEDQHHLQPPKSKIIIEKQSMSPSSETVILKETFSNRKHPHVRQNEWHLTSPFSDTQDWVQAIQRHGFNLTKAAAIPYPSKFKKSTHAPIPQIYLFQKI